MFGHDPLNIIESSRVPPIGLAIASQGGVTASYQNNYFTSTGVSGVWPSTIARLLSKALTTMFRTAWVV